MDGDRDQQTTEVREERRVDGDTQVERRTVASSRKVSSTTVAVRVVWYIAGIIIALLLLRILLLLLAANQGNAFVDFIYGLSGFFAMPFYGIFSYQPVYGKSTFEISSVVAVVIYLLVAWGVAKLLTLTSNRPVEE